MRILLFISLMLNLKPTHGQPKVKTFKEALADYRPVELSLDLPWARSNYAINLIRHMESCRGMYCAIGFA